MNTQIRTMLPVQVCDSPAPGDTSPDSQPPVLEFVASDETLDRYGEVINASGWELEHYRRNPVFQNAHKYGDVLHTLGRALLTEVRNGRLYQRVEFATAANPVARIAYGLYKGKFLNAVSVGFLPLEWEDGNAQTPWRRRYVRQELLEVSAVGIPANPNALVLGMKSGTVDTSDVREAAGLLLACCEARAPRSTAVLSVLKTLRDLTAKL